MVFFSSVARRSINACCAASVQHLLAKIVRVQRRATCNERARRRSIFRITLIEQDEVHQGIAVASKPRVNGSAPFSESSNHASANHGNLFDMVVNPDLEKLTLVCAALLLVNHIKNKGNPYF